MSNANRVKLPTISEEQALVFLLTGLRRQIDIDSKYTYNKNVYRFDMNLLLRQLVETQASIQRTPTPYTILNPENAEPYYSALSNLCSRGITAPLPSEGHTFFYVTEYGRRWLADSKDEACLPSEYGRFAQLLRSHGSRFGAGYVARSAEAVRCYEAHIHFACCAMCGAAAESILLALAIEKQHSEPDVLKEYRSANGRSKVEGMLAIQQKDAEVKRNFTLFIYLLKYWRDESAHGANSAISEEEAFTSMLLLLRFAQFADQRWQDLTT